MPPDLYSFLCMREIGAVALCVALLWPSMAAAANKAPCPPREAGQSYPWDSDDLMRGDKFAWVYIDVDRTGRALQCRIGENNIFDPDTRFQLCNAYTEDWHASPAAAGDPDRRTIKRQTIMIGSDHELANQKARKAWFNLHPEERPECYPE